MKDHYDGIICKGSYLFGSACGHCEKCKDELQDIENRKKEKVYQTMVIVTDQGNGGEYCTNCDCSLDELKPVKDTNEQWRCPKCGCLISFGKPDDIYPFGGSDF